MPKILFWFGWIFVLISAGILAASLVVPATTFDPLKNALPAGVLLSLAGHFFTQARSASEASEKRSLFFLESSIKAYEQAQMLLEDGNNERAKWIEAGRFLGHAKVLADNVTMDSHLRVLEINKLKYRRFFYDLLASKPGSFFYGVPDPLTPIDDAARTSTAPEVRNGRRVTSTNHALTEESIYAVWDAAQWPNDYNDPLEKKFTERQREKLLILFPGLHEFFEHKHQWQTSSGVLRPRISTNDEQHQR